MKLYNSLLYLIVISLSFNLSSCKKYSEDENRSLKTPKARLSNIWVIDEIFLNDTLVPLNGAYMPGFNFTKKGLVTEFFIDGTTKDGTWEFFNNEKAKIELNFTDTNGIFTKDIYEIIKLTNKELKLKYQYNSNYPVWLFTYTKQ
jgi:hypothetical protein